MKKSISILLVMVLIMSIFTGCAGTSEGADGESEETASTELNIYMWQQYISDDLIKSFEEENNATVNLSYMSDNADAITKLTAGGGEEYDLIMTCDAYMESLVDGDYIEKINFDNIPNASNINESYWTAKEYCVPYLMNYIYIVYNQDTSPVEITSYNDLIDPALKGQIATIDGARNLFPIALIALGYDPNSTNESEIAEAYEWLVKYNENVVAYGNAEQNLTNGTASVAFTYDGNASWAMSELGEDNNLVIADFEEDPVQLGFDLYVIPKGAKHVDLAEKFLNYITDPQVMAENLEEYPYSCPNDAAVEAASDTYKNDPARDFDYKENVFFQKDVGEAITIYNDYYQKLKVGE
ncbi:MAG TPA: spermidine/putrescine ABC transporter substrate-binding protein [Clostridiales bacterium]|jgi:spermidine/putrescine transport system substrate-binding protein|nr:spermidine/putrescine ABC transporter substrate-binding protein [Clostridiales bacterium]